MKAFLVALAVTLTLAGLGYYGVRALQRREAERVADGWYPAMQAGRYEEAERLARRAAEIDYDDRRRLMYLDMAAHAHAARDAVRKANELTAPPAGPP